MSDFKLSGFADEAAHDINGQIRAIKKLNWNSIELRTVNGISVLDLEEEKFEKIAKALEEASIGVCCLGSGIANWGEDITTPFDETQKTVKKAIVRMKRLKTSLVRIMSYKVIQDKTGRLAAEQYEGERIRRIKWICATFAENGLTSVHENCHTWGGLSYEHTLRLLDAVPDLKLVFDTGNPPITIDAKTPFPYNMQDSLGFYRQVKDFIVHVHIKDSILAADGKAEQYFYPGEGNGNIEEIVADLEKNGYSGYYSIEPHMEVVFHNATVQSSKQKRFDNFVEYGKRFTKILQTSRSSADR